MNTSTRAQRKWRRYLANERAEGMLYRELAELSEGEEREIFLGLVEAEERHAQHWLKLLNLDESKLPKADLRTRFHTFLARRFGTIFVLAVMQRSESRTPYTSDSDAPASMAADELIHSEVVRNLAVRGRLRLSGTFRAAVFGANDGLVSNLALVLGIAATGVANEVVLAAGVAGLLAGALSMAAGEYVSVRSQRELLEASQPDPAAQAAMRDLDMNKNELALVYRARGLSSKEALAQATADLKATKSKHNPASLMSKDLDGATEAVGEAWQAAFSSFGFFASGALIPILPFLFGFSGMTALLMSLVLVSAALFATGGFVGILSGSPPFGRAVRQLLIGLGAAAVTYALGLLFGTTLL